MLSYIAWEQVRKRNEALDNFVDALAMRKSLPLFTEKCLGYFILPTSTLWVGMAHSTSWRSNRTPENPREFVELISGLCVNG